MRVVVQRVLDCSVSVEGKRCARVSRGLLAYLGIAPDDGPGDIDYVADKLTNLRIFNDGAGKLNLSVKDVGGEVCVVSQFTLMGDARKGRRPSWDGAARPEIAKPLYEAVCEKLSQQGLKVERGIFQAHMAVAYTNDGPVTLLIDSKRQF